MQVTHLYRDGFVWARQWWAVAPPLPSVGIAVGVAHCVCVCVCPRRAADDDDALNERSEPHSKLFDARARKTILQIFV